MSKQKPKFFNQQKAVDVSIVDTCNQCRNSCCVGWQSIADSSEYCKNNLGPQTYDDNRFQNHFFFLGVKIIL